MASLVTALMLKALLLDVAVEPLPSKRRIEYVLLEPLNLITIASSPEAQDVLPDTLRTRSVQVEAIEVNEIVADPPDPTVEEAINSNVFGIMRSQFRIG
jgi:uroporphyrinogen-III synthase